jgi:hypothetical protein
MQRVWSVAAARVVCEERVGSSAQPGEVLFKGETVAGCGGTSATVSIGAGRADHAGGLGPPGEQAGVEVCVRLWAVGAL